MAVYGKRNPALNKDIQDQITRGMVEKIFGGGGSDGSQDAPLPDSCGECRFFHKIEDNGYGRCYRRSPHITEPIFAETAAEATYFDWLRPPVFPGDFGCGEGERRV